MVHFVGFTVGFLGSLETWVEDGLSVRDSQPSTLALPGGRTFKAEHQEDGGLGHSHRAECDEKGGR